MRYSNYLNQFCKFSALFHVPPLTLKRITDIALFVYASAALSELDKDNLEAQLIFEELSKYSKKPLHSREDFIALVDVEFDYWMLYNEEETFPEDKKTIECRFVFTPMENLGEYHYETNTIKISIRNINAETLNDILAEIQSLKETVRHELMHCVQYIITSIKTKKEVDSTIPKRIFFGLPGTKYKSKGYDLWGRAPGEAKPSQEPALMDLEFYTALSDSIQQFKHYVQNIEDPDQRLEMAKEWILDTDKNFFDKIKSSPKWDLAVKRFYSEISK